MIQASATRKRADGENRKAHIFYLAKKYGVKYIYARYILDNGVEWAREKGLLGGSRWK